MKKIYNFFLFYLMFIGMMAAQADPPDFTNQLVVPPQVVYNFLGSYDLDVIQTTHDFNPQKAGDPLNGVTTFAFEDFNNPGTTSILGPTIVWKYKDNIEPTVLNRISERTTCHWHGAHVPQAADGGPYQLIEPNTLWAVPRFEILDKSATMWYHPHAMGLTYKHVQMGLSGIIIVEDPEDDPADPDDNNLAFLHKILPHTYGADDFPLIFQTKKFEMVDGRMQIQADRGFKNNYEYMVNGIIDPVLEVPAEMIRLRILNGDGKFSFNFRFVDGNGNTVPAQLIATDAGYTDWSYQIDELLMAPGERTEWLLDLRGSEGTTVYVRNMVSTMPSADLPCMSNQRGIIGDSCTTNGYAADRNLLKINVVDANPDLPTSPIIGFPIQLQPLEIPPMDAVTMTREKELLSGVFSDDNGSPIFSIDSALMDMAVVNDVVMLGATEVWTLHNKTEVAHPWHIHDIHFWVTEVIDAEGNPLDKSKYPELFAGPKDNVLVQPGWTLSYITTFADYGTTIESTNSYMYHCHILPHEDKGMMGTFVVWDGVADLNDPSSAGPSMTVYPNPAQEIFYLKGESTTTSNLKIIDMGGSILKQISIPAFSGSIEVGIDDLPSGVFVCEWTHEKVTDTQKLTIMR